MDGVREVDEPEIDCMSSRGGTNLVVAEPEPVPVPVPVCELCVLVYDRIVRMEPVGEPLSEPGGIVTERSSASLKRTSVLRERGFAAN
jgi:hypothetical protein